MYKNNSYLGAVYKAITCLLMYLLNFVHSKPLQNALFESSTYIRTHTLQNRS